MKLVEILVRDFEEWPKDARVKSITQDNDRAINLYSTDRPTATNCGGCWKSEGFIEYLTRSNTLASDRATAIVTREMWQAERDSMNAAAAITGKPGKKANADGWIRHRGGKCPVEAGQSVTIRCRDGLILDFSRACNICWSHKSSTGDVMAWKIHKPGEQPAPEIKVTHIDHEAGVIHAESVSSSCGPVKAEWSEIHESSPIQWRDRIREIDRTVEALEEERVSLIQRLEGEGFRLIEQVNAKIAEAAQAHEDMSDWRNWEEGDLIESIGKSGGYSPGSIYAISGLDRSRKVVFTVLDDNGIKTNGWHVKFFKFHSRPSA